jgi:hypothetical protein
MLEVHFFFLNGLPYPVFLNFDVLGPVMEFWVFCQVFGTLDIGPDNNFTSRVSVFHPHIVNAEQSLEVSVGKVFFIPPFYSHQSPSMLISIPLHANIHHRTQLPPYSLLVPPYPMCCRPFSFLLLINSFAHFACPGFILKFLEVLQGVREGLGLVGLGKANRSHSSGHSVLRKASIGPVGTLEDRVTCRVAEPTQIQCFLCD